MLLIVWSFLKSSFIDLFQETNDETELFLRRYNASRLFPPKTWERNLIMQCRNKLAVKPEYLKALVFYSQLPGGARDDRSLHGGCPVIKVADWYLVFRLILIHLRARNGLRTCGYGTLPDMAIGANTLLEVKSE